MIIGIISVLMLLNLAQLAVHTWTLKWLFSTYMDPKLDKQTNKDIVANTEKEELMTAINELKAAKHQPQQEHITMPLDPPKPKKQVITTADGTELELQVPDFFG